MAHVPVRVPSLRAWFVVGLLFATLGVVKQSQAQATWTASRTLGFSVFGGMSEYASDFGADYKVYNLGYVVGGDATYHHGSYGFSIEPRYGHISGDLTTENYFLGDLKVEKALGPGHRLHPYGLVGLGYGTIHRASVTFTDNSTVYTIGPGIDVDLTHHFAVKGEFQYQFWNLGSPNTSFNPHGATGAIVYRFGGDTFGHRR